VRMGEGVLWLREGAWVPIPAGEQLSSRFVIGLRPAVDGGLWVLGHGIVARVQPTDDRAGFAVREELAPWVGHLVSGAADLIERPDGGLWIAHNGGLTHVPASSRRPAFKPPPVHLTELRVAGADAGVVRGAVRVPDSEAPVSLRFSAATYKAPALLRYRVRLDDGAWGEARPDGAVDLRGLDVGVHRVEVAASLDGARWTDPPAAVTLVVPPPWYGRWEVWLAALLAAVGLLVGAERLRAAAALRVERLRTSIALDLHDQVGAGLGAIGLLGGLLQRPDLPGHARGEAARRISATAEELSSALRGIVWSLRADTGNIEALGLLLAERARALLPGVHAAGGLRVSVSDQREPVDVEVLRAAQLIGLEALHNAARHAGASSVALRVERAGGATWRLVVEDDGVGIGAAGAESGAVDRGNGLASMAARAASVGATLRIDAPPAGGTAVVLTFRARRRWWARSMAPLDRGRNTG
jgi:signal transduction histidine kinase